MNLYQGKILVADLSSGQVSVEDLRTDWLRDYWGCWGLATRYYWDEVTPDVEPLSPENARPTTNTWPLLKKRKRKAIAR